MPEGIQSSLNLALSALEALGNTRRQVEHTVLSGMRRQIGWLPFANIGLTLAEYASKQHRDLERSLILQARKKLQPECPTPEAETRSQGFADYAPEPENAATPPPAPESAPALRLRVPAGMNTIALPIALQNHRDTPDLITMSLGRPAPHLLAFPSDRLYFDPEKLIIPAHSNASVQLVLRLGGSLDVTREYWSEILISGKETKRIPLALQFDLSTPVEPVLPDDPSAA